MQNVKKVLETTRTAESETILEQIVSFSEINRDLMKEHFEQNSIPINPYYETSEPEDVSNREEALAQGVHKRAKQVKRRRANDEP